MNTEAMNLALAKFEGWTEIQHIYGRTPDENSVIGKHPPLPKFRADGSDYVFHGKQKLPDYCNDLNAIRQVEEKLKQQFGHLSVRNKHRSYLLFLMEIVNPGVQLWDNGTFLGNWSNAINVAEATAAQKAEALCRALSLWKQ